MSFLDKIEELQKKPESYRKKILAVLMVVFMSIIIFIWLSTLNLSLNPPDARGQKNEANYTPFNILKEVAKESASKIKNSFSGAINQFKK